MFLFKIKQEKKKIQLITQENDRIKEPSVVTIDRVIARIRIHTAEKE
jgi:hypothetical protein